MSERQTTQEIIQRRAYGFSLDIADKKYPFGYANLTFSENFVRCIHTFGGDGDWYYRDRAQTPSENYKELARIFRTDVAHIVRPTETHTANVAAVTKDFGGEGVIKKSRLADTDAIITDEKGLVLCMLQSDCPLVYLYDPIRSVVGLVHSGRIGTEKHIVRNTITLMTEKYGVSPENLEAVIGPHICKNCYCVDENTAKSFLSAFPQEHGRDIASVKDGQFMLDLAAAIQLDLKIAGLRESHIAVLNVCTKEQENLFSYRRGDGIRSNLAGIMLEDRFS